MKPHAVLLILLVGIGFFLFLNMSVGFGLIRNQPVQILHLLLELRIVRALAAVAVGAAIGMAGASLQGTLQNPLADPYIIGVSSGAGFGAAGAIALGLVHPMAVPSGAILGALISTGLVLIGVSVLGRHNPTHYLLVGIAINAVMASLTMLLMFGLGPKASWVILWLLGDFGNATWIQVVSLLSGVTVCGIALTRLGPALNALSLGDDTAVSFGYHVSWTRILAITLSSCLVALSVSCGGIIGFVGLVVPHIIRLSVTADHRWLIPLSGACAAFLLLSCDTAIRVLSPTIELPIGVLTAFIGAPFFLVILFRYQFRHD
ncbi:iron ABC transporter permease [bacterium]|nr:iron ABC transporter permease [bacterium]